MGDEDNKSFGYFDDQPDEAQEYQQEQQSVEGPVIEWEASEYVHHEKSSLWFMGLGLIVAGIIALLYLFIENWGLDDWLLVLMLISMAVAVAVYASRAPQTLKYMLDDEGLEVGERFYSMEEFRSFSLIEEGAQLGIELIPLQRFRPPLSVYFSDKDGGPIVELLSDFLPLEEKSLDIVDRIVKKIRF